jgi:hypothetical protein
MASSSSMHAPTWRLRTVVSLSAHDFVQSMPELDDAALTEGVVEPLFVCVDNDRARGEQLATAGRWTVELRTSVGGVGMKLEVAALHEVAGEFSGRLFGSTTALDQGGQACPALVDGGQHGGVGGAYVVVSRRAHRALEVHDEGAVGLAQDVTKGPFLS